MGRKQEMKDIFGCGPDLLRCMTLVTALGLAIGFMKGRRHG